DQWLAAVLAVAGLFLPRLYILWEAVQERRGFPLAKGDSKEKRRQEKKNKRQTRQAEPSGSDKWTGGPNRPAEGRLHRIDPERQPGPHEPQNIRRGPFLHR